VLSGPALGELLSYSLCDQVWCLLVRGCVVESDDDLGGGVRDRGDELSEQACREVGSALAAAEEWPNTIVAPVCAWTAKRSSSSRSML
jgi:hypothetical protein